MYPQKRKNLIEIVNGIDDEEAITRSFIICFLQNLKEFSLIPYNQAFINEQISYYISKTYYYLLFI